MPVDELVNASRGERAPRVGIGLRHIRTRICAAGFVLFCGVALGLWAFLPEKPARQASGTIDPDGEPGQREYAPEKPAREWLELPEQALDLGEGKTGETLEGAFELRNSGSLPLNVRLTASCGCSRLSPQVADIGPGESMQVEVEVRIRPEDSGSRFIAIGIQADAAEVAPVQYRVRVTAVPPMTHDPAVLNFGSLVPGERKTLAVTLRDGRGGELPYASELAVSAPNPALEAVADPKRPGTYFVTLTAPETGPWHGAYLAVEHPNLPAAHAIPIDARIALPIAVAPPTVYLKASATDKPAPPRTLLVWSPQGHKLGALSKAELPAGCSLSDAKMDSNGRWRFTLRVDRAFDRVDTPVECVLRFEGLSIPARFTIVMQASLLK